MLWLVNLGFAGGSAATARAPTGGWGFWSSWEQEEERRRREAKLLRKKKKQAERIKEDLDKQLALAERELEEKELRDKDLIRMTELVNQHRNEVIQISERIDAILIRAVEKQTYSAREQLDREIRKLKEEEDFLIMAAEFIFNQ